MLIHCAPHHLIGSHANKLYIVFSLKKGCIIWPLGARPLTTPDPVFQAPMLLWLLLVMGAWLAIAACFLHKFLSSRYSSYILFTKVMTKDIA